MGKGDRPGKEKKKAPKMTQKEKKQAKREKEETKKVIPTI
jgi:hypothetical protein